MAGSDEVTRLADQREAGKLFDDTSCLVFSRLCRSGALPGAAE